MPLRHIWTKNPIKPRHHYSVTSSMILLVTQLYPCMSYRSRVHFNSPLEADTKHIHEDHFNI